jgi:large subunit ribosomal protein L4
MSEKVKAVKKKSAPVKSAPKKKSVELGRGARVLTAKDLSLDDSSNRKIAEKGFAIGVRALLQNWRQGTVAVKGRSDVSYSNKKPWRQKGTGRARAGSARSPLWRGGGICHGPQPRTRTLKVSKGLKRGVFNTIFWNYLNNGNIVCLDLPLAADKPRTALAHRTLNDAGFKNKKINVFVRADDVMAQSSFANIKNVRTLFFDTANAFDLATNKTWVVLEKDITAFKEMVSKWL